MSWLTITIVAYFLAALNSVIDKFLLKKSIPNPLVYSFYVGIFSAFVLLIVPFGLEWTGFFDFFIANLVGVIYLFALIAFFYALKNDEASRVVPLVGAISPVFILVMSHFFLGYGLNGYDFIAFIILILGGFLISYHKSSKCGIFDFGKYSCVNSFWISVLAAFLFAVFFVSAKYVFTYQDFITGFVFTRLGSFFAALIFLLIPFYRRVIFQTTKKVDSGAGGLFIANKALAGFAFLILNYALSVGSPALVNALEGIKYVFVLSIMYVLSKKFPHIIKEHVSLFGMIQKILAIILIFIGIFLLFEF